MGTTDHHHHHREYYYYYSSLNHCRCCSYDEVACPQRDQRRMTVLMNDDDHEVVSELLLSWSKLIPILHLQRRQRLKRRRRTHPNHRIHLMDAMMLFLSVVVEKEGSLIGMPSLVACLVGYYSPEQEASLKVVAPGRETKKTRCGDLRV